jgi:oligopeptide/dipeptide ABC transporter ATP-binding protein
MRALIELKNVTVNFPVKPSFIEVLQGKPQKVVHAVNGVDLSVMPGEIIALVGESGSGKTTLGKAINALHPSDVVGGTILFEGKPIFDANGHLKADYREKVAMIFQDPYQSLNPKQTIEKIVAEPLMIQQKHLSRSEMRTRVVTALEQAGLTPGETFLNRYPHELSGGQRQRVVIAGALVVQPKLIIADEPVSMLDVSIRSEILKLLMELRDHQKIAYLFITHDIALAWAIADKIAVMYLGTILEYGSAENVIQSPKNPYTQALIEIMPKMKMRRTEKRALLIGEIPDPIDLPKGCVFQTRCPRAGEMCHTEKPKLICVGEDHYSVCECRLEEMRVDE